MEQLLEHLHWRDIWQRNPRCWFSIQHRGHEVKRYFCWFPDPDLVHRGLLYRVLILSGLAMLDPALSDWQAVDQDGEVYGEFETLKGPVLQNEN